MYYYKIDGHFPVKGSIQISGNKNAALPCIAACLLSQEPIILRNIPMIEDVSVLCDILSELGVSINHIAQNTIRIQAAQLTHVEIPPEKGKLLRASILLAAPILARIGSVSLPPPGGDVIGRRRLDTHFLVFTALGVRININHHFTLTVNKLIGTTIFLDESSVTASENAIMLAVLAEGETIIENIASEPHVQDLCTMLNLMGAKISGIGSNILYITGVQSLGACDFTIGSDFMETASFIGLAAATRGELTLLNAQPFLLDKKIRLVFAKLGISWVSNYKNNSIYIDAQQILKVQPDIGDAIPHIDDAPWPGFPPDIMSIALTIATQVEGSILFHEKMFESRMFFVDKLISMGARIILCDPHRAVVNGPSKLRGAELISPDVRAGMALLIAAMCADGQSIIHNVYQIERGYENIAQKLISIGAKIERISYN